MCVCVGGQGPSRPVCVMCCAWLHNPLFIQSRVLEPCWQKVPSFPSVSDWTMHSCYLAFLDLVCVVGVCAVWAKCSPGGRGALALPQELLRLSQADTDHTQPHYEKLFRELSSTQIYPAEPSSHHHRGRKISRSAFAGNMSINKEPCMLLNVE